METWENVMDYEYESMIIDYVHHLLYAFSSRSLFFEYVNQTWIIPYKTYFIKAWANIVMHLGNNIKHVCFDVIKLIQTTH